MAGPHSEARAALWELDAVHISYATGWNRRRRAPLRVLDSDAARQRHDAGTLYVAVAGPPERPEAFVEVRLERGYVGVSHLDDQRRAYLSYAFGSGTGEPVGADDRLFLLQAVRHTFAGDDDEPQLVEMSLFRMDGGVTDRVERRDTGEVRVRERTADLSSQWFPVPRFGDYAQVLRQDW